MAADAGQGAGRGDEGAAAAAILASGLFAADWYWDSVEATVEQAGDAVAHYLASDPARRGSPHPLVDERFAAAGDAAAPALLRYLQQRSDPEPRLHPLFNPAWYRMRAARRRIALPASHLLLHYLTAGDALGLSPSPYFSPAAYRAHNPDVPARDNTLMHFIRHGGPERRSPHALFDTAFYLRQAGDGIGCANPLVHYIRFGAAAGLSPHADFDVAGHQARRGAAMLSADALLDLILAPPAAGEARGGEPLAVAARALHAAGMPPAPVRRPAAGRHRPVIAAVPPGGGASIRIAVLGRPVTEATAALLRACAQDATARELPLVFVLFETPPDPNVAVTPAIRLVPQEAMASLGSLRPAEPCHAALCLGPTADDALTAGLFPIAREGEGAADRVRAAGWGELLAQALDAPAINDRLVTLADRRVPPPAWLSVPEQAGTHG